MIKHLPATAAERGPGSPGLQVVIAGWLQRQPKRAESFRGLALHGARRAAEHLRGLLDGQIAVVAKDDRGALTGRKRRERGVQIDDGFRGRVRRRPDPGAGRRG
jgi:hypothetical protein